MNADEAEERERRLQPPGVPSRRLAEPRATGSDVEAGTNANDIAYALLRQSGDAPLAWGNRESYQ